MFPENAIKINITYQDEIITQETVSAILISIIESLLYQRNQIPFPYPSFKFLVSKWNNDVDDKDYENFQLDQQRKLALKTFTAINDLTMGIIDESKHATIRSARILFGATNFTPREAYIINLPKISPKHMCSNHRSTTQSLAKRVAMSLGTSEDLYDVFSQTLSSTNIFFDMQVTGKEFQEGEYFRLREDIDLPSKCKTVIINIVSKENFLTTNLNCCHDLEVFEGIEKLTLNRESNHEYDEMETEGNEQDASLIWVESKIKTKGFKDIFVRGRSIW